MTCWSSAVHAEVSHRFTTLLSRFQPASSGRAESFGAQDNSNYAKIIIYKIYYFFAIHRKFLGLDLDLDRT
jgi:hypothetical protein